MRVSRVGVLALAAILTSLAVSPQADAAEVCNPNGTDPGRFCVDYSLAVTSSTAAAPFDLYASVVDTSPGLAGDTNKWLNSASIRLTDASTPTPPLITRSDQLPDGLLLAGGAACTAPTYSTCGGGNGTLVANISSGCCSASGQSGAFGIQKVVNVNPPGTGNYAHYRATIRDCVTFSFFPGQCFEGADTTQDIVVPNTSGGGSPPLEFTVVTRGSQTFTGPTGGSVDYSLTSFSLHLKGSTNQVDGGPPLAQPLTIFSLPKSCGIDAGAATFVSGDSRAITVPQSFPVAGCPTAAVTADVAGLTASFDATASTTPLAGRSIVKWHWLFGDGTPEVVTTTPQASHRYGTPGARTATLTVEDSAGALSSPIAAQIDPQKLATKTSVIAKAKRRKINVKGSVGPASAPGRVSIRLLRKKGSKFVLVEAQSAPLSAGKFKTKFKTPKKAKKCVVEAAYGGDDSNAASDAAVKFTC